MWTTGLKQSLTDEKYNSKVCISKQQIWVVLLINTAYPPAARIETFYFLVDTYVVEFSFLQKKYPRDPGKEKRCSRRILIFFTTAVSHLWGKCILENRFYSQNAIRQPQHIGVEIQGSALVAFWSWAERMTGNLWRERGSVDRDNWWQHLTSRMRMNTFFIPTPHIDRR